MNIIIFDLGFFCMIFLQGVFYCSFNYFTRKSLLNVSRHCWHSLWFKLQIQTTSGKISYFSTSSLDLIETQDMVKILVKVTGLTEKAYAKN